MNLEQVQLFLGNEEITVAEAMKKIDENSNGFLFIVDDNRKLKGCITDGDIRRWILKTGEIETPVKRAMTYNPKYILGEQIADAEKMMEIEKISVLPILDCSMRVVDIILKKNHCNSVEIRNAEQLSVPVVIMAGGKGTRLEPYTKVLPKPLIPINGIPIIERIIKMYHKAGMNNIFVTLNYKKNMIKSYFSECEENYNVQFVEEMIPLGTGGSLKLIEYEFDVPMIVTNCDSLIITDYRDLYRYHIMKENDITVVASLKNYVMPYGVIKPKEDCIICSLEEKPQLSYFVNTGMYIINPKVIDLIPDNRVYHMTDLVNEVLISGGRVGMYPISGDSFLDMGEFNEMARMEELVKDN